MAESGTKLFLFCLDLYLYTVAIFKVKMFFVFLAELGNSSSLPAATGPISILLIFSLAGLSFQGHFRHIQLSAERGEDGPVFSVA